MIFWYRTASNESCAEVTHYFFAHPYSNSSDRVSVSEASRVASLRKYESSAQLISLIMSITRRAEGHSSL